MSGIFLVFGRDGQPVPSAVLPDMARLLAHRGRDGCRVVHGASAALGHLHQWITPEERGEHQPLRGVAPNLHLAFDGRLDNRSELIADLGWTAAEGRRRSDASIALAAFERWGEDAFARLLGPFAIAILDSTRRRALLARDPLGDRPLCYSLDRHALFAASEEAAVVAGTGKVPALNPKRLAAWFAIREPEDGGAFLSGVEELLPAHLLVVEPDRASLRRYWQPPGRPWRQPGDDRQRAARFQELLGDAVSSRLRASSPPAALLSGGLDSGPMVAMAALALRGTSKLQTVSWFFDEHPDSDERTYIDAIQAQVGIDSHLVRGDGAGPFDDLDTWPFNPSSPEETPYRRLMERAYGAARAGGSEVVLAGTCGDDLYCGGESWWWAMVRALRFGEAASEGRAALAALGARAFWRTCMVRPLLPAGLLRAVRPESPRAWMTPEALELLGPRGSTAGDRTSQQQCVLSLGNAHGIAAETRYTAAAGIELRYPFRDRRLVEFLLTAPAFELYRGAWTRPIARRAMQGLLPAVVLTRRDKASLDPLYRAATSARPHRFAELLSQGRDSWAPFVRSDWVARTPPGSRNSGQEELVLWHCICLELWRYRMLDFRQNINQLRLPPGGVNLEAFPDPT